MKKIIVTGALGHIGSRVIRDLPSHFPGASIVMIDNLSTQRYCSLFDLPTSTQYRFMADDILTANLGPVLDGADAVLHFAAITNAAASFENSDEVEHNNYNGTARVAEACVRAGCPLVFPSSTSVYGTQNDVVDEECSLDDLRPQSPYAETKLREENLIQELGSKGDLKAVIFRFGTICGTSPGMRFHTAVNKFCWQAVMGQPLTVWRTALHQKRPYLDLSDAVRATAFIIENQIFESSVYNVLTDNLTVETIIQAIRRDIPNLEIEYVDAEIMNQLSYEVSTARLREQGFTFKGNLAQSIRHTIELLSASAST